MFNQTNVLKLLLIFYSAKIELDGIIVCMAKSLLLAYNCVYPSNGLDEDLPILLCRETNQDRMDLTEPQGCSG